MKTLLILLMLLSTAFAQMTLVPNKYDRKYCEDDTSLIELIVPYAGGTWSAPISVVNNKFRPSDVLLKDRWLTLTYYYTTTDGSFSYLGSIQVYVQSFPTINIINKDSFCYASDFIIMKLKAKYTNSTEIHWGYNMTNAAPSGFSLDNVSPTVFYVSPNKKDVTSVVTIYATTTLNDVCAYAYDEISLTIFPEYRIYIPNALPSLPMNRTYYVYVQGERYFYMAIYNRWGGRCFEAFDGKQQWDVGEQQGIYFYEIFTTELNNTHHKYTGTITVL